MPLSSVEPFLRQRKTVAIESNAVGMGVGIRATLGDIDPLNKVPFKRARSRVQKGYPLRGLPNNTT